MIAYLNRRSRSPFVNGERGASAVEFALIVPVFMTLLLGFYDIGIVSLQQVMLTGATDRTMRELRINGTINADGSPTTVAQLEAAICDRAVVIPNCVADTVVEIREVASSAALPTTQTSCIARDPSGTIRPNVTGTFGGRQARMLVRVCAISKQLVGGLPLAPAVHDENGDVRITAVSAFVNE